MKKVAVIGGGVIGGGWLARFLIHGWDVNLYDPNQQSIERSQKVLVQAEEALSRLIEAPFPKRGKLEIVPTLNDAISEVDWVQESVPERLSIKHEVYRQLATNLSADTIVASSTSGFTPSALQQEQTIAAQIIVAHPYNPVYLLPMVELVASDVSAHQLKRADELLTSIGMSPVKVGKEIEAHVGDRLLEAMWREALWLIKDEVATVADIDKIITHGFGLRWGQMGLFETYRIAGGESGMRHFLEQFGPCLQWPWTKLTDVPDLTDALIEKIAKQSDEQAGQFQISELERIRDNNLIAFLKALKKNSWAAGIELKAHEERLYQLSDTKDKRPSFWQGAVLSDWIDYNGHMTEYCYLRVFGESTDNFLRFIGVDDDYIAGGHSYYTVETHIRHLREAKEKEDLKTDTQVILSDLKRVHLFHQMWRGEELIATGEHLLLHVDATAGKSIAVLPEVREKLAKISQAHQSFRRPKVCGRGVGENK